MSASLLGDGGNPVAKEAAPRATAPGGSVPADREIHTGAGKGSLRLADIDPNQPFRKMQQAREFWIYGLNVINKLKNQRLARTLAGCIYRTNVPAR